MKKGFIVFLVGLLLAALCLALAACNNEDGGREVEIVLYDPYDYSVIESGDVIQIPTQGTAIGVAIRDAETGRTLTSSDIPQFDDVDVVIGAEGGEAYDVRELTPTDCLSLTVYRYDGSADDDPWDYFNQVSGQECADAAGGIFPFAQWPVTEGVYKFKFTFSCYAKTQVPQDAEDWAWAFVEQEYVLRLTKDRENGAELLLDARYPDAQEVYALAGETVPFVFQPIYSSDYTFTATGADVEFVCADGVTERSADGATLKVRGNAYEPLHIECKNLIDGPVIFDIMTDITPTVLNAGDELTFTFGESGDEVVELPMEKYTMLNWYVTGGDISVYVYRGNMSYDSEYGASGTDPHGYIYCNSSSRRFLVLRGKAGTEVTLRVEEPPVIELGKEYTVRMSAEDVDDIYDTAYSVITPYSNDVRLNVAVETGAVNVERYSRSGSSFFDPLSISVWDETCFGGKELSQYISCIPNVPSYIVLSPGRVSDFTYSVDLDAQWLSFGSNTILKTGCPRLYYFSPGATMDYVMSWQNIGKVTLYDADGNELSASFMGMEGETYYVVVNDIGESATLDIAYADMATYDMISPITGVMGDEGFVCARFVAPESCRYAFVGSGIDDVAITTRGLAEQVCAWAEFDAGQEVIFKLYGTPGEEYSFELEIYYLPIDIGFAHNVDKGLYSFEITEKGNYEIYAYSNAPENISVTLITPEGEEIAVAATGETLLREFVPGTYIVRVLGLGKVTFKINPAETV